MPLDATITAGQLGHITDHQTIADTLNDLTPRVVAVPAPTGVAATDTAAVQAAITLAKTGGTYRQSTLRFNNPGLYELNAAIDFGSLVVEGPSFASGLNGSAPFGGALWASPTTFGTVILRSSLTSGTAFTRAAYGQIKNIMLLGPGTGTSTGLASPTSGLKMITENLVIANFSVGLAMTACFFNLNKVIHIQGCTTGLQMSGNTSNCNTFLVGEIRDCGVGLDVIGTGLNLGGSNNIFDNITFQYNIAKGAYLHGVGASANIFRGCWFENPDVTVTHAVHVGASADATILEKCLFASVRDDIEIAANRCAVLYPTGCNSTLTNTGAGNQFLGRFSPGNIVDNGTLTALLDPYDLTKFGTVVGAVSTLTESARSGAVTLTSADLNRMQVCTVASAYTLTLPIPVGVTGQQIGVRVTPASTNLLTLATAAGNIDGVATRILWAGESAILESDGTNWVKIAGKTIPMTCAMRQAAAQTLPDGAITAALIDTTVRDNTGLMASTGSNLMTVKRPGLYAVAARSAMDQPATAATRFISLAQKNGSTAIVQQEIGVPAGTFPTFTATDDVTLAAGDTLKLQTFQLCATPTTRNFSVGSGPGTLALTVREIPQW